MEDWAKYAHSPAHLAVARRDHESLKRTLSTLPRLAKAGEVTTEAESLHTEALAESVSSVIDRRDVPGRETPLHLAVRLRDATSADLLMGCGADWTLQNEHGWSALQEAVCNREDSIARIIARHYQPLAWAKWCRRLPRIIASANRIRDFYMEMTFHFESSVIPFIARIAPSDTYRIWKRGSSLRADMTLAGFDGLRIQRSDQSFVFLGDGHDNPPLPRGSLIALSHKEKEVRNALEGAGVQPTEAEVAREVALMSQTNMFRPGIDVTQAELVPVVNWRRQERSEMVGNWKAKVYEMLHVMVSVKSRRVPGAMTDDELFTYDDVLTDQEKSQLDSALHSAPDENDGFVLLDKTQEHTQEVTEPAVKDKRSWFGWSKKTAKSAEADKQKKNESEYKKGLRPVFWLTPDFPLKTEELLPLLDILSDKVKAIRRLRELLTTKLPAGTFPVKVAIPIIPTIRVLVTFTRFEELPHAEEFSTPLSSPARFHESTKDAQNPSWVSWMKGSRSAQSVSKEEGDPFQIPPDYVWVDATERKRRLKAKKAKNRRLRKEPLTDGAHVLN